MAIGIGAVTHGMGRIRRRPLFVVLGLLCKVGKERYIQFTGFLLFEVLHSQRGESQKL